MIYLGSAEDHVVYELAREPHDLFPHAFDESAAGPGPYFLKSGVLQTLPTAPPELMIAKVPLGFDIASEAWFDPRTPGEIAAAEEAALAAERATMEPFVRAFRAALKLLPAAGYLHLLDQVTQLIEGARTADPFSDLVVWWDGVTQIVREHPDMDNFGAIIDLSPLQIDAICRLALAIERGEGATAEADLVAAFVAL